MTPIRVLVVDDSAFARKVIREVLSRDSAISVVGVARDGAEALEKIADLRPDVITLDLMMPDVDGLAVLRALSTQPHAPRVLVVTVTQADAELAIAALESGAVDLVTKPTALATDRLYDLSGQLVTKVKAAAAAKPRTFTARAELPRGAPRALERAGAARLVVIGTSTGGPQALMRLFSELPSGLPVHFAVALHIPAGYPAPLAARISQMSGVPMEEAREGMELEPGKAVIAPGGQHLRVTESDGRLFAALSDEPRTSLYHPSVDVLFSSAAALTGSKAVGVVLTGMGDDGLIGSRAIRKAGGRVVGESASSCVVYGMPRAVIENGVANHEAPLDRLPALLLSLIQGEDAAQSESVTVR